MARRRNQIRETRIEPFASAAPGSVMITQGQTRVLCTASVSAEVPAFLMDRETGEARQGWVTAEYAMLPGSTPSRKRRGTDSRATEIQRLIGRSLRQAVDLSKMAGVTITCDCDVVSADGGTRTASITGAYVALMQAVRHCREAGLIERSPVLSPVAAISVGIIEGEAYLDLDYPLDSRAEVDMNVVMNGKGAFIELQGTAEGAPFEREQLDELLDLAGRGIRKLMGVQREALR